MFSFSMQPSKYGRGIGEWRNGWSPEELDRVMEYCDSLPLQDAIVGTGQGAVVPRTRDSNVAWVVPNEACRWIYERLQQQIMELNATQYGFALTGFETLQFTSYRHVKGMKAQHYTWHVDDMGAVAPQAPQRGECRKLSAVLQLSDPLEYDGGDLHILSATQFTAHKERGLLMSFPSFVRHRVTPVTRGRRCTLVAWAYGPEFV